MDTYATAHCYHCGLRLVRDGYGDWLHIATIADRPCSDPEPQPGTEE